MSTSLTVCNILGHVFVLSLLNIAHCHCLALDVMDKSKAIVIIPIFLSEYEYNSLSLMFRNFTRIHVGVKSVPVNFSCHGLLPGILSLIFHYFLAGAHSPCQLVALL